jgi:hypothetical protein
MRFGITITFILDVITICNVQVHQQWQYLRDNVPIGWKKTRWTTPRLTSKFVGGINGITSGRYIDTLMETFDERLQSNAIAFTNQYAKENKIRYNGKIIKNDLDDLLNYFTFIKIIGLCPQPEIAECWKNLPSIFGNWQRCAGTTKFKCRTCNIWLHPKSCYNWHVTYMQSFCLLLN